MAKDGIIGDAKSFIDKLTKSRKKIPDSTNIGEQLSSALDSVIQGILDSALGKAELGKQLDVVKKNNETLKPLIGEVFGTLESIKNLANPITIMKINMGMKMLERINMDPLLNLINKIDEKLRDNKLIMGSNQPIKPITEENKDEVENKNNPLANLNAIIESIKTITDPKNIIKLIIGCKLLKRVNLDTVWKILEDVLAKTDNLLKGKDLEAHAKNMAKLVAIVHGLKDMMITLGLTSVIALMVAPIVLIGLPIMMFIMKFTMKMVAGLAKFSEDQQKSIAEGRKAILAIGATFILFALTMYLIGEAAIDPNLWKGLIAFTLLVGVAVGVLYVLSKLDKPAKEGIVAILAIGAAFALFTLTIILIGEAAMDKDTWEGFGMFVLMVTVAVGVLFLLQLITGIVKEGGLALLAIGGSFALFALTIILLGEAAIESWEPFGMFVLMVLLAVSAVFVVSLAKEMVLPGAIALAIIAGSFIVFIGVMALLQILNVGEEMWFNFAQLLGIMVIAGAVCVGLGFLSPLIIPGAIALGAIAVALLAASISLLAVSYILPLIQWDELIDSTWKLAGFMWRISVVCAESLVLGLVAIPGLAVLLAISTSLLIVSVSLLLTNKALSKIDWESLINSIGSENGVVGLLDAVAGLVHVNTLKDLAKVMLVCPVLIAIGKSLKELGEGLQEISKLDVNLDEVTQKASSIITTLISAFAKVAQEPEVNALLSEKPGFFGQSTTSKMVRLAKDVSSTISNLATGVSDLANLTVTEYDKNGNVKSKRQLNNDDFKLAGDNIAYIISTNIRTLNDLVNDKDVGGNIREMIKGGGFLGLGNSTAAKVLEVASQIGGVMGGFAENIAAFASGDFKNAEGKIVHLEDVDYTTAAGNIGKLIKACVGQFSGDDNKNLEIDEDRLNGIKTISETLGNVSSAVNKVDVSKLEKMTTLMETLYKFGSGINFSLDGLADIINEKLVKTLEELRDVLEEVGEVFESEDIATTQSSTPATNLVTGNPPVQDKPETTDKKEDKDKNSLLNKITSIESEIKKFTKLIKNNALDTNIVNEPTIISKSRY